MIKICNYCNKEFIVNNYRAKTAKYCSKKCVAAKNKATHLTIHCAKCEKEFIRESWKSRSSSKGQYCSRECYESRSPQQTIKCQCGVTFQAYQSRLSYYSQVYCSRKCYMQYGFQGRLTDHEIELDQYEIFTRSLRSTVKYLLWAKSCRERDRNECVNCLSKDSLTVHHKQGVVNFIQKYGFDKEAIEQDKLWLDLSNGETLCRSCHLKEHQGDKDED